MNYVVDGETFDVPIKMDTIEGDTLFILDQDLILNTDSSYYQFKNAIDDLFNNVKDNWDKYKIAIIATGCSILALVLLIPILKAIMCIKNFIGKSNEHENK